MGCFRHNNLIESKYWLEKSFSTVFSKKSKAIRSYRSCLPSRLSSLTKLSFSPPMILLRISILDHFTERMIDASQILSPQTPTTIQVWQTWRPSMVESGSWKDQPEAMNHFKQKEIFPRKVTLRLSKIMVGRCTNPKYCALLFDVFMTHNVDVDRIALTQCLPS